MSDLYLDLKRRIPVVTEWTDVGTEEIERAQARTGLSDERLAREIPVSAKTWSRWKRRGAIPTHLLGKVAPLLGFEIVPVESIPLPVSSFDQPATFALIPPDLRESLAVLVELLQRIAEIAERSEAALGRIEKAMPARDSARPQARRRS